MIGITNNSCIKLEMRQLTYIIVNSLQTVMRNKENKLISLPSVSIGKSTEIRVKVSV